MLRTFPSQAFRFIASILFIIFLTPLSSALAQQKPAPPSPQSQAQLEEHVKELEKRLDVADQKAASAAMEKDYITRVQKQYESYYKEVLSTQTWTLGIFGFILTAVFAVASKFSLDIFDSRTKSSLDAALAQVEKKFSEQMQKELETLRQHNSVQLKALEDGLTKRISSQEQALKTRPEFQFNFSQGLAMGADKQYADSIDAFRSALDIYKSSKPQELIQKKSGTTTAQNIFVTLRQEDEANIVENAKKELANELYDDLEDELAQVALSLDWFAPLLKERKQDPSPQAPAEPKTREAEPAQPPPDAPQRE